jgi:hypothetical protein
LTPAIDQIRSPPVVRMPAMLFAIMGDRISRGEALLRASVAHGERFFTAYLVMKGRCQPFQADAW